MQRVSVLLNADGIPVGETPDIERCCFAPSSAQFQLWLAQSRRDKGRISDKEMAVVERVAGALARKSIAMFNPFTGEKRKVELP